MKLIEAMAKQRAKRLFLFFFFFSLGNFTESPLKLKDFVEGDDEFIPWAAAAIIYFIVINFHRPWPLFNDYHKSGQETRMENKLFLNYLPLPLFLRPAAIGSIWERKTSESRDGTFVTDVKLYMCVSVCACVHTRAETTLLGDVTLKVHGSHALFSWCRSALRWHCRSKLSAVKCGVKGWQQQLARVAWIN